MWLSPYILPSSFTPLFWLPRLSSVTFLRLLYFAHTSAFSKRGAAIKIRFRQAKGGRDIDRTLITEESFDTHIRTRPKRLLHLDSLIWDAHQVPNPPFSFHVKKIANDFPRGQCPTSPTGTMPLTQNFKRKPLPYPLPSFVKAEQQHHMALAKRPYSVLFLFIFLGRGNPHTPETFSVGLGLPPSSRTQ